MKIFMRNISRISMIISSFVLVHNVQSSTTPQVKKEVSAKRISIATVSAARFAMIKIINQFPQNTQYIQKYEKDSLATVLQCAKILGDTARSQILEALSEIDRRITYWRYQKNHQWQYFVSKNPIKWFTGPKQEDEINDNLETLESHQGELYVLLGQLSELDNSFAQGYKDIFLTDYTTGYEWIDAVLTTLARIKTDVTKTPEEAPFITRAQLLKAQLYSVERFKETILSDISETALPSHLARNWLRYAALLQGLRYGYQHYEPINQALTEYFNRTKGYLTETFTPVRQLFLPRGNLATRIIPEQNLEEAKAAMKDEVMTLYEKKVIKTEEEKNNLIADIEKGNTAEFQKMLHKKLPLGVGNIYSYTLEPHYVFLQQFVLQILSELEKESVGTRNLVLLTPAIGLTATTYYLYQKLTERHYGPIREALVDINSLFVDQTKPLTDEQYGKMIYLVYNLKKRAAKEVPEKDRENFIHDLARIESKEYDVAAKRAIVEDMFKKYSFLGLVQNK